MVKSQTPERLAHKRELERKRRAADPERFRAAEKARYAANPEKYKARQKARRVRDLPKQQAKRATISGRVKDMLARARWVSSHKGRPFDLTYDFVARELRHALAAGVVTCESNRPDTASLDQIEPAGGYTQENVQVVPQWYNQAKHDFAAVDLHRAMENWRLVYG